MTFAQKTQATILGLVIGISFLLWQTALETDTDSTLLCYPEESATLAVHVQMANNCLGQARTNQPVTVYQDVIHAVETGTTRFEEQPALLIIKAQALMNLHKFAEAYSVAEAAITLDPNTSYYYGVLGDAALELGQYEKAREAYQTMANIRPDFGVFVRVAYFRELNGDIEGALLALDEASSAGSPEAADMAWLRTEQGRLLRPVDLSRSNLAYQQALEIVPEYPVARLGLAENLWFSGSTTEAIHAVADLHETDLTITHTIMLADMYHLVGEAEKAERLYAVAEASLLATEQLGQNIDRDLAIFYAERGLLSDDVLLRAERVYQSGGTIAARVAYARLLLQSGEFDAAEAIITPLTTDSIGQHDPSVWLTAGLLAEAKDQTAAADEFFTTAYELPGELALRNRALVISKRNQ